MPRSSSILIALFLAIGCASSSVPGPTAPVDRSLEKSEAPHALRVGRTLIYPVQWGRAEEIAETLRPLLINRYGPGAQVVVHESSNHLLITIPPVSARDAAVDAARDEAGQGSRPRAPSRP